MSDNAPKTAEIIQLYDDASPELKRVLERKLGNAADAEEILQDAFEKLLRLSDRQHIRDLRRYFFTMANNMALNALQHRDVEHRYRAAQSLPTRTNGTTPRGPSERCWRTRICCVYRSPWPRCRRERGMCSCCSGRTVSPTVRLPTSLASPARAWNTTCDAPSRRSWMR